MIKVGPLAPRPGSLIKDRSHHGGRGSGFAGLEPQKDESVLERVLEPGYKLCSSCRLLNGHRQA